jgi:hypothetical protein
MYKPVGSQTVTSLARYMKLFVMATKENAEIKRISLS